MFAREINNLTDQTLDPEDWTEMRQTFHAAVDHCLDAMQTVRQAPVWQPLPETLKPHFSESLPLSGSPIPELFSFFQEEIQPYATGNTHPRFFGWVHGSGTAAGVLGEMLAAFLNCNAGGRDHIAITVEQQIIQWCQEIFSFPKSSSGILTSGTSLGTLIALSAARTAKSPGDVQKAGLRGLLKPLVGYASAEAHSCTAKTFDLLGLGQDALRRIPVGSDFRMDTACLRERIKADKDSGFQPFAVIASAGTVNTGAIDDLEAIAEICREHSLWMHVNAAFGGLAVLTPEFQPQLAPIAGADSVAFDFHKWLHVPYDAGCVLVKDADAHKKTFSTRPEYLAGEARGLAGGEFWPCDYGPELSRGFRALKIWFTLKTYGVTRLAELIAQNCRHARSLGGKIQQNDHLELLAPVTLNIVCFRYIDEDLDEAELNALNTNIVAELQLQGIAAPSITRIGGKTAIRVALTNHRTRWEDLEILIAAVCRLGQADTDN